MSGGFSKERLARMHDVLAGYVERGEVPGIVTLLSRRGELHVDVLGAQAFGGAPMRRDTIFRITSMTKPVVAAAAMILVEECRLRLDEPLDGWLPELADRRVLRRPDAPLSDTVPAQRALTLRDLLTFRLGLGLHLGPPVTPIQKRIHELGLLGFGPPQQGSPLTPDAWLAQLATLPLVHQPGEAWMYNTGSCVLGVLLARVARQPLETFLRERIFAPLGMRDTGFHVPPEKQGRFASSYWTDPGTGRFALSDAPDGQWSRPPAFPDGAAGLVSTLDDYHAFGRMMLERGRCAGGRVLSRLAVEAMTTDQLTPAQKSVSRFFPGFFDSRGWGFGLAVVTQRDDLSAVPGRFGWDGGFGTSWYADPHEEMSAILMTQRGWDGVCRVHEDFWTLAYQAIED